jgi:hypothetical protein
MTTNALSPELLHKIAVPSCLEVDAQPRSEMNRMVKKKLIALRLPWRCSFS